MLSKLFFKTIPAVLIFVILLCFAVSCSNTTQNSVQSQDADLTNVGTTEIREDRPASTPEQVSEDLQTHEPWDYEQLYGYDLNLYRYYGLYGKKAENGVYTPNAFDKFLEEREDDLLHVEITLFDLPEVFAPEHDDVFEEGSYTQLWAELTDVRKLYHELSDKIYVQADTVDRTTLDQYVEEQNSAFIRLEMLSDYLSTNASQVIAADLERAAKTLQEQYGITLTGVSNRRGVLLPSVYADLTRAQLQQLKAGDFSLYIELDERFDELYKGYVHILTNE